MYRLIYRPPEVTLTVSDDFTGSIIGFSYPNYDEERIENGAPIWQIFAEELSNFFPDKYSAVVTGENRDLIQSEVDKIDFLIVMRFGTATPDFYDPMRPNWVIGPAHSRPQFDTNNHYLTYNLPATTTELTQDLDEKIRFMYSAHLTTKDTNADI